MSQRPRLARPRLRQPAPRPRLKRRLSQATVDQIAHHASVLDRDAGPGPCHRILQELADVAADRMDPDDARETVTRRLGRDVARLVWLIGPREAYGAVQRLADRMAEDCIDAPKRSRVAE